MADEYRKIDIYERPPAAYRYGELPAESAMLEELLKGVDFQHLFESYYNLIHIPVAIIDLNANVLFSSRWQRICAMYHRINPATLAGCLDSDKNLAQQLAEGKSYTMYACRNGLTDCASPIIVEGKHIANLFVGQFLTKQPDEDWFRERAREFGFDADDYLAALREVPIVDEARIPLILDLLKGMTTLVTNLAIERKRALEAQARQSVILNTIPQSVFWKDVNGRYLGYNMAFAKATGVASPEDIIGKTDFDLPWPRQDAEAYRADDAAVISANQPRLHIVEPVQRADGSRIVVDTSKIPLVDAVGSAPTGVVGIYEDITERKRAEVALNQLNRQLRAISACNEFLVRASEEKALLEGICNIICEQGDYRMAWVGFAERDEGKTVRPAAWAGAENGYVSSANISWADTERGRGPTGACIRNAKAIYIGDFATDPRVAPWRDNAMRHGFRSSIALPLKGMDGTPFGALMVYSADANAFIPDEIQLLDQLANDLAFGITALRTRTERVKAEESLRKSEERFQLSMEATSDGLWDWNAETNEVYYSPACYHMLDYEVGDFPGTLQGWQDLLHPEDVEHTMKINMDCVEGRRETFAVEYRLRAKNGEWRWILGRGKSIVRDAQGRALRLVGTNTDITERRRAEERLHESETRFRSAFMTGAVAFVVVEEATGKIFEANDQFLKLYGYDREEVIGHTSLELGMWAIPEARAELLARLQESGRVENFEVIAARKDGERFWVLYSVNRLTVQGTQLLLGAINDITARKVAEQRIEDYVKQLEGTLESTLQAVSSMVEMRDPYTAGHELRVGQIAAEIAREMGWPEEKQKRLQLIGLVHDIGKIAVPAEILTKPTRLSALEFELVKAHAERGYEILKDVRSEMPVAEIIRQHHERMDGSGYPQGLKGDQILMEARILAVADVLESMASHRPYRPALGVDAAIKEISGGRGTKFDETVVDTLLRMIREKGYKLPE